MEHFHPGVVSFYRQKVGVLLEPCAVRLIYPVYSVDEPCQVSPVVPRSAEQSYEVPKRRNGGTVKSNCVDRCINLQTLNTTLRWNYSAESRKQLLK